MTFVNLIGRVHNFEQKESEGGVKYTELKMSVMRPYKNYQGNYETDYFRIPLFDANHKKAQDYLRKGMGIAIKGRLEMSHWVDETDKNRANVNIIAEQLFFLPKEVDETIADLKE